MEDDSDIVDTIRQILYDYEINHYDSELSYYASSSSSSSLLTNSHSLSPSVTTTNVFLFVMTDENIITEKNMNSCIEYYTTQLNNWDKTKKSTVDTAITTARTRTRTLTRPTTTTIAAIAPTNRRRNNRKMRRNTC